jgi:hypothetical protein
MRSGVPPPVFEPFNPFVPQPKMSYKDGVQKRYFVLDSFEAGSALLKKFAASISAPALAGAVRA